MRGAEPVLLSPPAPDLARRFGGVARLYGEAGYARLAAARVCVIGLGGVGSWAAEALARSAVGMLGLIDLDMIAESNTNRQLHALGEAYGRAKVEAMAERVHAINPSAQVAAVEDFVDEANVAGLLQGYDAVIDAIDNVRVKAAIAAHCRAAGLPLVVCGGAGGQTDPTRITVDDLARAQQDPLLAKLRARLRKDYGFPREPGRKFGIAAVYSLEPLRYPDAACAPQGPQGLACAGFGSAVVVTASFGLFAAARVIDTLVEAGS